MGFRLELMPAGSLWYGVETIEAAGPAGEVKVPEGARTIELAGTTLIPGLIDAHTHVLLHPYNEALWNDQVLKEALALRVCRATNHLRSTLLSGFTTIRDLGTEGAGYADVGLKQAVAQGIIPGPRMLVVTRAIVATGSYAPKGFAPELDIPQGAEEADGVDSLIRVVRDQIGKGADWIKVYADTAMGGASVRPSFSLEELTRIVETARSVGVLVSAHATSKEGMRRAALAGVATIEHGDGGDAEVFKLMAERGVALCPTLAAFEASARYRGYRPGTDPEPARLKRARATFKVALEAGVTIANGSDMGVFAHGDGARELELLVDYRHETSRSITCGDLCRRQDPTSRRSSGCHQARPSGRPCLCRGRPDPGHQNSAPGEAGDEGRRPLSRAVKTQLGSDLSVSTTIRPSGCVGTTVNPGSRAQSRARRPTR